MRSIRSFFSFGICLDISSNVKSSKNVLATSAQAVEWPWLRGDWVKEYWAWRAWPLSWAIVSISLNLFSWFKSIYIGYLSPNAIQNAPPSFPCLGYTSYLPSLIYVFRNVSNSGSNFLNTSSTILKESSTVKSSLTSPMGTFLS